MFDTLASLYNRMGPLGSIITALIVAVFISGFYINILIRRKYISLSEELASFCAGRIDELRSEMLVWITEEYKSSLDSGIQNINTEAIVDVALEAFQKPCILGENYLRKVNGILITTGLFGTFLGLTTAIGTIGGMMVETGAEELMTEAGLNTFEVLLSSFQGMSVAFITSLLGTGFSILLSILMTFYGAGNEKNLFIAQLQEYLDIKLASESVQAKSNIGLEQENEIKLITETLNSSISSFNNSVSAYTEELKSLEDFNRRFKQNIELADKSVAMLCQSLDTSSDAYNKSSLSISSCSEMLHSLVKEILKYHNTLEGLGETIERLNLSLNDSSREREEFLRILKEVPDRLLIYSEAAYARIERGRVAR